MSFFTSIQNYINPIKSTFTIGDLVHQEGEKQAMIVIDFHRAPHSKLPLIECEWYDAKDLKLRHDIFPQQALVKEQ